MLDSSIFSNFVCFILPKGFSAIIHIYLLLLILFRNNWFYKKKICFAGNLIKNKFDFEV